MPADKNSADVSPLPKGPVVLSKTAVVTIEEQLPAAAPLAAAPPAAAPVVVVPVEPLPLTPEVQPEDVNAGGDIGFQHGIGKFPEGPLYPQRAGPRSGGHAPGLDQPLEPHPGTAQRQPGRRLLPGRRPLARRPAGLGPLHLERLPRLLPPTRVEGRLPNPRHQRHLLQHDGRQRPVRRVARGNRQGRSPEPEPVLPDQFCHPRPVQGRRPVPSVRVDPPGHAVLADARPVIPGHARDLYPCGRLRRLPAEGAERLLRHDGHPRRPASV